MLTIDQLKQVVHNAGVSKTDAALLCVAAGGGTPTTTKVVRKLAIDAGVKGAKKINFSAHLASADDKVFRTPNGWELNDAGRAHVASLAALVLTSSPAATEAQSLRKLLPKLKNEAARAFVSEAIVCSEQSLLRAAVVLSWVGAMAVLHEVVVNAHLGAFNSAATKRDSKWRIARTADDLSRMKELVFLEIAEEISVIGKNVRQELDSCLKLRNACGHPNSLRIGPSKVAAHLETLTLNVFAVYC